MFTKILTIAKWIAGVFAGVTAIAGIIMFIYTRGVKDEKKNTVDSTISSKVDKLVVSDSIKTIQFTQILQGQTDIAKDQKEIFRRMDNIDRGIVSHLKMSGKIDELINYLENEKKNKGNSFSPIVSNQNK